MSSCMDIYRATSLLLRLGSEAHNNEWQGHSIVPTTVSGAQCPYLDPTFPPPAPALSHGCNWHSFFLICQNNCALLLPPSDKFWFITRFSITDPVFRSAWRMEDKLLRAYCLNWRVVPLCFTSTMKTSVSGAGQVEPRPRQYLGPDLNLISGRGLQTVQQAADNQDNSVCGHRHQQQSVYLVTPATWPHPTLTASHVGQVLPDRRG